MNRPRHMLHVRPWMAVVAAVVLVAAPGAAEAQAAGEVARIGYLSPLSPAADATRREGLRQGLEELGYREGQNMAVGAASCVFLSSRSHQ